MSDQPQAPPASVALAKKKRANHAPAARAAVPGPSSSMSQTLLAQTFLEVAPDAMLVADVAGRVLQVNHQTEVLFGYARTELLGSPVEILLPERHHVRHRGHRAAYAAEPHTRPMGANLALLGRRRDGSEFPVEVSLSPLRMGEELLIIASVRDVSERTRLEHERAADTARLRVQTQLLESAHDAIFVRDPEDHIVFWNRGATELYGWTAQQALGQVSHIFFQTRFPIALATVDKQLITEGQWEGELVHTCRDGRVLTVDSRQVVVRDEHGHPTSTLEINRDVTERKRFQAVQQATLVSAERERALLQTLLDQLPGGAYVWRIGWPARAGESCGPGDLGGGLGGGPDDGGFHAVNGRALLRRERARACG